MDRDRLSRELRTLHDGEARIARWAGYGEVLIAGALFAAVLYFLIRLSA